MSSKIAPWNLASREAAIALNHSTMDNLDMDPKKVLHRTNIKSEVSTVMGTYSIAHGLFLIPSKSKAQPAHTRHQSAGRGGGTSPMLNQTTSRSQWRRTRASWMHSFSIIGRFGPFSPMTCKSTLHQAEYKGESKGWLLVLYLGFLFPRHDRLSQQDNIYGWFLEFLWALTLL